MSLGLPQMAQSWVGLSKSEDADSVLIRGEDGHQTILDIFLQKSSKDPWTWTSKSLMGLEQLHQSLISILQLL